MLVPFRQMWCLSEPNIDGFFLSSLILQFGKLKNKSSLFVDFSSSYEKGAKLGDKPIFNLAYTDNFLES